VRVPVLTNITEADRLVAEDLRAEFARRGILVLNLIASPGAGKTTLLERTITGLGGDVRVAVVEGDLETSIDAERIAILGAPAVQINTGGGCHLEARMLRAALGSLPMDDIDVLIVENVGNLVCPTAWDLGEDVRVVVASLAEGDDKPLKYPSTFASAQVVVINKVDLEPYLPARIAVLRQNALRVNGGLTLFDVSCTTGAGVPAWLDWLRAALARKRGKGTDLA
jgi:hydrogenase nickel incorporation protein HypB